MAFKKATVIPSDNHILRNVPPNKLRKDENDNVIGILGEAFKLRDGESYLSATLLEHFPGSYTEQTIHAVKEIRKYYKVKPKAGFAIGKVGDIKAICEEKKNRKIFVVSHPTKTMTLDGEPYNNASHVAINSWPSDDMELLELLASETWCNLVLNNSVPD